jgi:hypothetical protein
MYSDETDFCRRIKTAGWEVRHLPQMTILHHDGKAGVKPSIVGLGAHTRMMYARKFFSPAHRAVYLGAVMLRHLLRAVYAGRGETGRLKRASNRHAIATLIGRAPVPYAAITSKLSVQTAGPELRAYTAGRAEEAFGPGRFVDQIAERPDRSSPHEPQRHDAAGAGPSRPPH